MGLLPVHKILGVVLLVSAASSIRVQSISEARERIISRRVRSLSTQTSLANGVVLLGQSLVFNTGCFLMETASIKIWVRASGKSIFDLDADISNATYNVAGRCTDNGWIHVWSDGNFTNSSVIYVAFSMRLRTNGMVWNVSKFNMSVIYNSPTNGSQTALDVSLTTDALYASVGASYYCNEPTITNFVNTVSAMDTTPQYGVMFGELILEPFFGPNKTADSGFDPMEPCQYAFNMGIWMALITGLIMTLILSFGMSMLSSITPMDRFDDPKSIKLLSVSTE